ncbi:CHAT domain-containing protein [Algoriphagus halophytocola]|uniref:CHAT domain-containing protein n=1 Tax=Algoriphagus halophytocola TaxID=2991499 RepID=A0ABY6MKV0_9BACT|nr:CHAT domain-containing protein [Algoriphagus sp. TR-M5]UZD23296.1 CHAT domain-containing protein [Algoriphagus sp. TR-M5]
MANLKIRLKGQDHLPFLAGEDAGFELYDLSKAYTVLSPTRGDVPEQIIEVDDDTIVELAFEDDTVWMGDSETIRTIFPDGLTRSADGDVLYLPDEIESETQERGIFKKIALKLVKIFVKKKVIQPKMRELAFKLENKQLAFPGEDYEQVNAGVLARCSPQIELSTLEFDSNGKAKLKTDAPYLLLLHGTASSTQNSFGDLKKSREWLDLFNAQSPTFKFKKENILAFQHRSLTASPLENILDLVKSLPKGIELHLLSQSRGGLLAELLARCCADSEDLSVGFDDAEIALLLKSERDKDLSVIKEISEVIKGREIKVTSMVRVAGPANGTTLASKRLNIYLNVTFNLIGLAVGHVGNPIYVAFKEFVMGAVACKDNVDVLPGLEAMNPESPFIKALNNQNSKVKIKFPLLVVGGSAELSVSFKTLVVLLGKFFFRGKNDLVVDTESMKWGSPRVDDQVGVYIEESGKIDHFKYFCTPATLKAIIAGLSAISGSIPVEFTLRSKTKDRGAFGIEHGSYARDKVTGDRPILILIPGIMGSNIGLSGDDKDKLVWINYLKFFSGNLENLDLNKDEEIGLTATSLIKTSYKNLGERLSNTYDIVTFQFDWRKPLKEATDIFEKKVDQLLKKNQSIKIAAHSMGGVLVRDFMVYHKDTWKRLNESKGFKGVFLGSPLGGSFRIPYVLFGHDGIIKLLGKIDIKHSTKELLEIFCDFPGILNLLPIDQNGAYDFSDRKLWENLRIAHGDNTWPIPSKERLKEFGEHQKAIWNAEKQKDEKQIDFSNFSYIAGQSGKKSFTISNLEIEDEKLVFYATNEGDESVTWASGIPKSMREKKSVYYANVTHGSLSKDKTLFQGIEDLLAFGETKRLQNGLPVSRGVEKEFVPVQPEIFDISEENVFGTLLGINEEKELWHNEKPISVVVTHGDLKYAQYPVLAGHFEQDVILNAEAAIDKQLGGELSRLYSLGLYPGKIGSNQIVLNESDANTTFKGGIIIGLGTQGELSGYYLINSVEKGVARYLTIKKDHENDGGVDVDLQLNGISVIAIANNYGGLSTDNSIRAIISGVQRANRNVQKTYGGKIKGIEEIEIIELYNDRALSILKTIQRLNDENQKDYNINFKGNGLKYSLGKQIRVPFDYSSDWWTRINVSHFKDHLEELGTMEKLRMSITTNGASEKVESIPSSDQTLDILLKQMTVDNQFSPEIATAMFELLVPLPFKEELKRLNNINWVLDTASAAYPWEMLLDAVDSTPLCVNIGMVRQLATGNSRGKIAKVPESTALVIGDPVLEEYMPQLPGAKQEALAVSEVLRKEDFDIVSLVNTKATDILLGMFSKNHKIIHLAGHGVFRHGERKSTGMVIGNNTFLTPGQIAGMSSSAELIFVNCCYLGQMDNEAELRSQQSNKFAANIGTQLINNGARAVIVAGWAVDDTAALDFSMEFYRNMFNGYGFGEAVKRARAFIYNSPKSKRTNTWGAFQCYGDPFYKLVEKSEGEVQDHNLCREELEIELENLLEMMSANEFDIAYVSERIENIHKLSEERGRSNSRIKELIASVYAGVMNYDKACTSYQKLFEQEKSGYSVRAFEQYCNIRAKFAIQQQVQGKLKREETLKKINEVISDLQDMNRLLGETSERISLLGSTYKRRLQFSLSGNDVDMEALEKAMNAYQEASEKCNHSDPYPLCNWLTIYQLKVWKEGKSTRRKADVNAGVAALYKLREEAVKQQSPTDDYWSVSHLASMALTSLLLEYSEENNEKALKSNLMLWTKAGHAGHKAAETEHLGLLISFLKTLKNPEEEGDVPFKNFKAIYKTIETLKRTFEGKS